ncbi:hypothetical protein POJ06DRAFT_134537 [Lipomyces tetrasporus]|uniref:Uncharacterized protein n=1 Tax=Lipomyces tetrasporus TaxID=54092 RepID=A0AAD7QQG6_9ASCO|nr:uncharacterized protein POJ06DRAFT_134537 [Lipomyces tetrasporus]KAJ8099406.1 hypothetical protein POJ06DRAFT_134537 [Lipomyces tetrasporus]
MRGPIRARSHIAACLLVARRDSLILPAWQGTAGHTQTRCSCVAWLRFERRNALLKHIRLDHGLAVNSDEDDNPSRQSNTQKASGLGIYSDYGRLDGRAFMGSHPSYYYSRTAPACRRSALVSAHFYAPMPGTAVHGMDVYPENDDPSRRANANYYVQRCEDDNRTTSGFSSTESSYSENLLTSDTESEMHNRMSSAAGFRPQLSTASPLSSSSFFYDAASRHLQNPQNSYQYQQPRHLKFHLSEIQYPNSPMIHPNNNFQAQNCLTTQVRSDEHGHASTHVVGGSDWM